MEAITNRMVDLNSERQQDSSILVIVFSKREHGRKKIPHVSDVDVETAKADPRDIRDEKYIFPGLFLRPVSKDIAIAGDIFCINALKMVNISILMTP